MGKIYFSTNWEMNNNIDMSIHVDYLLHKYNNFILNLKNLDSFKTYSNLIMPIPENLLLTNSNFLKTEFISNVQTVKLSLPNSIELNYDNVNKLASCFFPYISIIHQVYYKTEEIEYFDDESNSWIDAIVSDVLANGN